MEKAIKEIQELKDKIKEYEDRMIQIGSNKEESKE